MMIGELHILYIFVGNLCERDLCIYTMHIINSGRHIGIEENKWDQIHTAKRSDRIGSYLSLIYVLHLIMVFTRHTSLFGRQF